MDGQQLRKTVLEVVRELGDRHDSILQSASVLQESAKRLGINGVEQEQALLAFFGDLFRIGYLAWGYNLSNPAPPFCHITNRGRAALAAFSRDPSNPDGYLANLHANGKLNPIAESYIREALATYAAGCFKATAVMVGAAAESVILEFRDSLGTRLDVLRKPRPPRIEHIGIGRPPENLDDVVLIIDETQERVRAINKVPFLGVHGITYDEIELKMRKDDHTVDYFIDRRTGAFKAKLRYLKGGGANVSGHCEKAELEERKF